MKMTPKLWMKVTEALEKAMGLALPERKPFLAELRDKDAQVADEVEAMLQEQLQSGVALSALPDHLRPEGLSNTSMSPPAHPVEAPTTAPAETQLPPGSADPNETAVHSPTPSELDETTPPRLDPDQSTSSESDPMETLATYLPRVPRVRLRNPDEEDVTDREPSETIERYPVLEEIARGGMGAVHKAHDPDLGRNIAVKVLLDEHEDKPGLLTRFVEEAQIGGQLQHPGIVPVYEIGTFRDSRPYFTMKLVKGQTLASLLAERDGPDQDLSRFLKIFEQVCQTLAYAHSRGVIHRDLKPANIMVGSFGEVQVMDWGLAKVLEEGAASTAQPEPQEEEAILTQRNLVGEDGARTQAGSVLGTPAYMPREQAIGDINRMDERADVFGLGAILCEILTGEPPYTGLSSAERHQKASRADLSEAFTRLAGCGADSPLIDITRRCLAVEPEGRPRTAKELADELTTHRESVEARLRQTEVEAAEARARADGERKRFRLAMALAAAVVGLVILGGGGWFYLSRQKAQREHEELARQTKAIRNVEAALQKVNSLRQQAIATNDSKRWAEALTLAEQALGMASELPPESELAGQARSLAKAMAAEEKDRRLLERLEEVWLLRAEIDAQSTGFALTRSLREYAPLFERHGLRINDVVETGADWVQRRSSPVREGVIAGLDAWLGLARQLKAKEAGWLLSVLQAADENEWRKMLRAAISKDDEKEVERLVESDAMEQQFPQTVLLIADFFRPRSQKRAEKLLRATQARYPGDFWINFALAETLYRKHFTYNSLKRNFEDVVRFFSIALSLRPDNLHVQAILGWSLCLRGNHRESKEMIKRVIARRPGFAGAHTYLGWVHLMEGEDNEAEKQFREAIRLQPRAGYSHVGLAFVLWGRGEYSGALLTVRRGNRHELFIRGLIAEAGFLGAAGRVEEMIEVCNRAKQAQKDSVVVQNYSRLAWLSLHHQARAGLIMAQAAIRLQPENPECHLFHRCMLLMLDEQDAASKAAKRAVEVWEKGETNFPGGTLKQMLRETKQIGDLRTHLSSYVKGEQKPSNAQELTVLTFMCYLKKKYKQGAQLSSHALLADPELTKDVRHEHRYIAATYAMRAAAGKGDASGLEEKERSRWRAQARLWLQADLVGWRKILSSGVKDDRDLARERLSWWRDDPLLASVREPKALKELPAKERESWQRLWAEVAALTKNNGK